MPSLRARNHELANAVHQLTKLHSPGRPGFREKLSSAGMYPLRPGKIEILQINVGKTCNQTCAHCHVDAGPDRRESMSRQTMEACLKVLSDNDIPVADITGGAPELNPHFRWLVRECRSLGRHIIDRCNLTIIVSSPKHRDLPDFFAENRVEVVSSLPHYTLRRTDSQRGEGVFNKSIEALRLVNMAGYGMKHSGLVLNLVYNPTGAILPGPQAELEAQYRQVLRRDHGVEFNNLIAITNMPISRFLEFLLESGNYISYMDKLIASFNPAAISGLMCRNTLSVGWDGRLYDCDFNQMLEIGVNGRSGHISEFSNPALSEREIALDQHCYGCTAGSGSGCGGQLVS